MGERAVLSQCIVPVKIFREKIVLSSKFCENDTFISGEINYLDLLLEEACHLTVVTVNNTCRRKS